MLFLTNKRAFLVRLTAFTIVVFVSVSILEITARLIIGLTETLRPFPHIAKMVNGTVSFDAYEMASEIYTYHWSLKPGSFEKCVKSNDEIREDFCFDIDVNSDGYRGANIPHQPSGTRILAIGDSVTFGLSDIDFPSELERLLPNGGGNVKVINAGVEGYRTRNALLEFNRHKRVKADYVILFIGWNDIFAVPPGNGLFDFFLIDDAFRYIAIRAKQFISGKWQEAKQIADRVATDETDADEKQFAPIIYEPVFFQQIELLTQAHVANGSCVVIVTLPGLFVDHQNPGGKAKRMGHLPRYTEHYSVLASLTKIYNRHLKSLEEKLSNVVVFDAAEWSINALHPRDQNFSDSVHMSKDGLQKISAFFASQFDGNSRLVSSACS